MISIKQIGKNIEWDQNPVGIWLRAEFEIISENELDRILAIALSNDVGMIFVYTYEKINQTVGDFSFDVRELSFSVEPGQDSIEEIALINPEFANRMIKNIDILTRWPTRSGRELFCFEKYQFVDHVLPEFLRYYH